MLMWNIFMLSCFHRIFYGNLSGNTGGPFPTPPHRLPFAFGFKDYTPHVFRALRALNNVEEADYMTSLAGDFNYIEFLANSKSGQFFFYSHDGRFMIKTQTREEARLLRDMLPSYVKHLVDHPDSLIARFYGLHRVEMPTLKRRTFFVVMQSVFYCPVEPPLTLHVKFDLKGSTIGRRTEEEDCLEGAVQKDLNFAEQKRVISLGKDRILLFAETLRADVNYLKELRIMDYSLLLGIHDPLEEMRINRDNNTNNGNSNEQLMRQQRRRSSGGVILAKVIRRYDDMDIVVIFSIYVHLRFHILFSVATPQEQGQQLVTVRRFVLTMFLTITMITIIRKYGSHPLSSTATVEASSPHLSVEPARCISWA